MLRWILYKKVYVYDDEGNLDLEYPKLIKVHETNDKHDEFPIEIYKIRKARVCVKIRIRWIR